MNGIKVKNTSLKRIIPMIGAALFAALFLISGVMLYRQYADGEASSEVFESIAELVRDESVVVTCAPSQTTTDTIVKTTTTSDLEIEPKSGSLSAYEKYAAIYEQNHDFVGWISIEGTNINYPVMQTVDRPNYYLNRDFDRNYSQYGVPYVQEDCDLAVSDNLVIYGHHMKNGSMFADLCRYEDENFYKANSIIRFDTLTDFGEYEIIAVFKTVAYSTEGFKYYNFVNAENEEAFDAYVAECKDLSLYEIDVNAEYGDKLITLSTCEYSRTNGRMVVVAKRMVLPDTEVREDG